MHLDISNIFETPLKRIKEDARFSEFKYPLYFPNSIEQNAILFIGMNPSNEQNQKDFECYDALVAKDKWLQYYSKMSMIAKECEYPWTHIDLFHYRDTRQKMFFEIHKMENGVQYLNQLLAISDSTIKMASPKLIVVSNALAGEVFRGNVREFRATEQLVMKYDVAFDETIGTHRWKDIPVFFSSMLSGQRALDNGSYERLKWHIKKVLGQIKA